MKINSSYLLATGAVKAAPPEPEEGEVIINGGRFWKLPHGSHFEFYAESGMSWGIINESFEYIYLFQYGSGSGFTGFGWCSYNDPQQTFKFGIYDSTTWTELGVQGYFQDDWTHTDIYWGSYRSGNFPPSGALQLYEELYDALDTFAGRSV